MHSKEPVALDRNARQSAAQYLVIIILSIFIAEALIMALLSLLPPHRLWIEVLIDSILMIVLISPALFYWYKHRETETALSQSEHLLQTTFDTMREVVFVIDPSFTIVDCNSAVERVFGYQPHELIGQPYSLLIPEMTLSDPQQPERERQLFKQGYFEHEEFYFKKRSGVIFPASLSTAIRRDDQGNFLGTVATVQDITEHKWAKEALQESEEQFRTIMDKMLEGCQLIGFDWRYIYVNDAAAIHGRIPKAEKLGRLITDVYPGFENTEIYPFLKRCMDERISHRMVTQMTFPDGYTGWFQVSIQPVPDGIFLLSVDITERKWAEVQLEKLKKAVESSHEVVFMTDRRGLITYINPEFTHVYGYRAEEVVGQTTPRVLKSGLMTPHDYEVFWQTLLSKEAVEAEFINKTKDERTVHIAASANPVLDDRGDIIGFLAIQRDITEQKRLEAESRKAEILRVELEKEKEIVALKDRFVSIVSHEFRTPLAIIQVTTDLLDRYKENIPPERLQHSFHLIRQQIKKLSTMIDEVLTISRIQSGRITFNPIPVDLESFCRKILDEVQFADSVRHQFDFRCNLPDELIRVDTKLLHHVLTNLLTNAVKYSPDKSRISLELDSDIENIIIKISDEGIGIPQEDQGRLFEPFHRAENVGSANGTGLGLSIAKEYVELHGGSIRVDSEVEKGSIFSISLPKS